MRGFARQGYRGASRFALVGFFFGAATAKITFMKFLLTNDDGIDAVGLEMLARAAAKFGEVVTVAPHTHLSGCSHRVTTDEPFRAALRAPGRWAIEGTPADCVRVGL